ncbi:radical SAM family heme chaperone HemW [Halioxenophilus sp. WMMB6]|uniref:radical SAM family heme chaperone HemW n=1 Tax=Halioxenophilus sp. WMMB6 TaxID=3073815 RepID=UPI00295E91E9|nr:radical SAM family heme chaperone HemW [Halioxenophilus sp. WMMB6]
MTALPPLSLYVHIPWCVRKCPYCDFNSHRVQEQLPERDYVAALERDLIADLELVQGRAVQTIFFGGGTPSLFSADAIGTILELVARHLTLADSLEVTLEANPGTVEQSKFIGYWQAGVNRLSIGVQSFQAAQLQALGRIHSGAEAQVAIAAAQKAGFEHINIDLMHGLPGQTPTEARADLETAAAFGVDHISWYQLTIEPNTQFYSQPPLLPNDDALADIQDLGAEFLAANGWRQYEVSAFARAHGECRHNINYWRFGDYLGIGAGAHGKITDAATGAISRRWKTRLPEHYLQSVKPLAGESVIARQQQLLEFCMNALRLVDGVELALVAERTGQPFPGPLLKRLQSQGLLQLGDERLVATPLGFRFLNSLLAEISDYQPTG